MAENIYSKGTRVWFTDKDQGWISAEVINVVRTSGDTIKLTFVDDRGKVSLRVSFLLTFDSRRLEL
jgi:myosin V